MIGSSSRTDSNSYSPSFSGKADPQPEKGLLRRGLLVDTLSVLSVLLGLTLSAALLLSKQLGLGYAFVASAVGGLSCISLWVVAALPGHPYQCFGYANIVTAFRASLVSLTGAALVWFEGLGRTDSVLWSVTGTALFCLALDGVDGYLARKRSEASPFGARFDMEIDALLVLILSLGAALLHKVGSWVILIGAMRYAFIGVALFVPALKGQLFPSFRRKFVCVLQVVALCFLVSPLATPPYATLIAGMALLALTYSFAVDIIYLLRRSGHS